MFHMEFPVKPAPKKRWNTLWKDGSFNLHIVTSHLVRKTTGIIFVHLDDLDGYLNESGRPSGGMIFSG